MKSKKSFLVLIIAILVTSGLTMAITKTIYFKESRSEIEYLTDELDLCRRSARGLEEKTSGMLDKIEFAAGEKLSNSKKIEDLEEALKECMSP